MSEKPLVSDADEDGPHHGKAPISPKRELITAWECSPFPTSTMGFHSNRTPEVSVVVVKSQILIPKSIHYHDEFEFYVPLTAMPQARAERRIVETPQNVMMPFNSGQDHGSVRATPGRFLCVMISSAFMREVTESAFGRRNINFSNVGIPYTLMLQRLLSNFAEEADNKSMGYAVALQGLSLQICVDLLRRGKTDLHSGLSIKNYNEEQGLARAIDLMMSSKAELNLDELAGVANLSRFHFIRVFKQATGKTPWEYLISVRLEKACKLLKQNVLTISDISQECGFDNPSYFSTAFKRAMGVTPSEYRHCQ